jgi:hypothetical protein
MAEYNITAEMSRFLIIFYVLFKLLSKNMLHFESKLLRLVANIKARALQDMVVVVPSLAA